MQQIDWSMLDPYAFQAFCNALLLLEVSKQAKVFSKEGKDKGIDQLFQGAYMGKSGKWRFQDKYHASGKEAQDIAELKRDIKKDIEDNYNGEDLLVFLTNVNLTSAKHAELEETAKEALARKGVTCEFILWHGAHLDGLISAYPVLYNWFWDKESVLLQQYEDYFKRQLSEQEIDLRYQLKNVFFGRTAEMQQLESFLGNDRISTAAIIANGGYGKTRLALEFFKSSAVSGSGFIPVVLTTIGFSPKEFAFLLKPPNPLLILIDNAHERPEIIPVVKQLIENHGNRHKLLLTTRPTLFGSINKALSSFSRDIERIELKRLSYNETKSMFSHELSYLENKQIVHLTEISKGIPNVILEVVRLIKQGKEPGVLREETAFAESVQAVVDEQADDIERSTGISREATFGFLQLVALLSPLHLDEKTKTFIAELLDIKTEKVGTITEHLTANGVLDLYPAVAIKPDPYSDVILVNAIAKEKDYILRVINTSGAETYTDNILKNLSEADLPNNTRQAFIDELVRKYVEQLKNCEDGQKVVAIFKLVRAIIPYKPWAGLYAIDRYIKYHTEKAHPVHVIQGWQHTSAYMQLQPIVGQMLYALTNYSKHVVENRAEMLNLVERLVKETGDVSFINNVYAYHEWSFAHGKYVVPECSSLQKDLKEYVIRHLNPKSETWKLQFCFHAAELLQTLEFQMEEFYEQATGTLTYGQMQVPYCSHIRLIRIDIIKKIIEFYNSAADEKFRQLAFNQLLEYFFYASNGFNKRHTQKLDEEISLVFAFVKGLLEKGVSLEDKAKISGITARYSYHGYKEAWKVTVAEIKALTAKASNNMEALELLLMNTEYFEVRNHFEQWMVELVAKYPSVDAFIRDLLIIRDRAETPPPQFQRALTLIGNKWPDTARALFNKFQERYPQYIHEGLGLITPSYKDEAFFPSILDWLWERKEQYIDILSWLMTSGRNNDKQYYRKEELVYIKYILDNGIETAYNRLAYCLIDYAYKDKEETFRLLDQFLKMNQPKLVDSLLHTLFIDDKNYAKDYAVELKDLFYVNRHVLSMRELMPNQFLLFLHRSYGFEEVVNFVVQQVKDFENQPVDSWRRSIQYYQDHLLTKEENAGCYTSVVEKYIEKAKEDPATWDIVMLKFSYGIGISPEQKDALLPVIKKQESNKEGLLQLAAAVNVYEKESEEGLTLLCTIAEACLKLDPNQSINDLFKHEFYINIGSKSKTGVGVAYDEDIIKKNVLEKILAENGYSPPIKQFLETALKRVIKDIDFEIASDQKLDTW